MPDPSLVLLPSSRSRGAIPIIPVTQQSWPTAERALDKAGRTWLKTSGFTGGLGKFALLPGRSGHLEKVFYGIAEATKPGDPFEFARLVRVLPAADYRIDGSLPDLPGAVLGWLLESYRFERYRAPASPSPRLVCPSDL